MRKEQQDNSQENDIQREYSKIDKDWLTLHYMISIATVIFALIVECVMSIFIVNSDLLNTTFLKYVIKFIAIPSGVNFICIGAETIIMKSKKISQLTKIYIVSIVYVIICFVLFTVHGAFTSSYYIISGAIILTTVYASFYVTLATAICSIALMSISELFITWDVDKISIFHSILRLSNFLVTLFILLALSIICMIVIRYERKKNLVSIQLEKERILLQERIITDELTGIYNRKALHDALSDMEDYNQHDAFILAIIDIDKFKMINDRYGHQIGDKCLVEFAKVLKENSGKAIPFRYGGDEFCLLFQNADRKEALQTCELIQSKLKYLDADEDLRIEMTASFGLAEYNEDINTSELFVRADQALYQGKVLRGSIKLFQEEGSKNNINI
ncbi:GGDEF domain-containing protein [Anaerocolumna chitinilytica]|uniref:GGDEF domain-containing protein n=1 Tax=Anaerocolumna chitinilytica TaxID=1727145 RepID=A0A7I8DL08_9FIRM|nr:GGDEF domain-containing protein [Anaerocolumna chitinilytica]BCJ99128.1 hypothetical protein bsdcttw_21690 [Anaerocolumna chitinilytica]